MPNEMRLDGQSLGNVYSVVLRDGIDGPIVYTWPPERVIVYSIDDLEWSLDATTGASVDDLIDDIDAVLDSYRENADGLRG